ncbi:MAG: transcriptional repressor LexA [Verrucomicrobia bacterium]|nr:transcriptional repressor LexA [Verrucomicrobiota bacterium]MDA1087169.1 transcriptional repressor LexA [Verrucomicrobiota bacterium]
MSPKTKPGATRERIYRYVRKQLEVGLPPTTREVQAAFGFRAVQTAREHLERLVHEGLLVKRPGKARGYGLPSRPSSGPPPTLIPLLGRVQAGGLNEAIEHVEDYIPVTSRAAKHLFGLRVRGESMTGAGIFPDDIVIVHSQPTAENGQIVVALVGDEATVKTLRIRRKRIELHPENSAFEPIIPPPNECSILGKVIEVRRVISAGKR